MDERISMHSEAKEYLAAARRLMNQGDALFLNRQKLIFYRRANQQLNLVPDEFPEKKSLQEEVKQREQDALAGESIDQYHQACVRMNHADSADSYYSAEQQFQHAEEIIARNAVCVEQLSQSVKEDYLAMKADDTVTNECRKRARSLMVKKRIIRLVGLFVLLLLIIGFLLGMKTVTFRSVLGKTEQALGLYTEAVRNYKMAYDRYASAKTYGNYVDSLLQKGKHSLSLGDYAEAAGELHLPAMENYPDADTLLSIAENRLLSASKVGETIAFGGEDWLVLEKADNTVLIIKEEAIGPVPFNNEGNLHLSWEYSDIKNYLNGSYLYANFSAAEREMLQYGGTEQIQDSLVWLLDASEFKSLSKIINSSKHCCWLRNEGSNPGTICFVTPEKSVMDYGYPSTNDDMYIKPVIQVQWEEE